MSAVIAPVLPAPRPLPVYAVAWAVLLAATIFLHWQSDALPGLNVYPEGSVAPFASWISQLMLGIKYYFTWLTRGITAVIDVPLDFITSLLAKGFRYTWNGERVQLPALSWVGIVAAATLLGWSAGGRSTAIVCGVAFLYIALFGQWQSAMLTLALIVLCVPLCVVTGVLVGVAAHGSRWLATFVVRPALDLMQTVPTFAYLVPMLLLFGNNPVSALLATGIFAVPPMVRATLLALERVPVEISEFATMAGCSRRQKLWRVMLPAGRETLMVGVNQVIMLALNMVIIASMIGAGGLGYDVLLALRALRIGNALEAGLAIVALAIALDRLGGAYASRRPRPYRPGPMWQRHPQVALALGLLCVTWLLALWQPALAKVPESITLTTAPMWKMLVDWITLHFFDVIEAVRTWLLLNLLNPTKQFMNALPWTAVVAMVSLAGLQLGGVRLALLVGLLTLACAMSGLWEKTMTTIYLCGVSTFISAAIGIPIGVLAARHERINKLVQPIIDTLQTLPSFVFLIPVVMLFRVGDVTAMIAIVSFAIVPAVRYTVHGLRSVPPSLVEAATVAGCTPRQTLWRVQLPLALPEIMLGMNQTILLALSMLVITALVGTRDLGQEVYISLAKADAGRGIVAGLAVAFIGIVADRLMAAWSQRTRERLRLS